ncbi:MAG: MFS transporter [Candidatus Nezhaarchaeales archaeon]
MAPRAPAQVLAVVTASHFMQHLFMGTSVLFPLIVGELGLTYTEFGLAMSAFALVSGLMQALFGAASRRVARRVLLGLGNFLLALGTLLTGLSRSLLDFLAARLISGIGSASYHPVGTAIVSEHSSERSLGRAIGLYYGLAYVGNVIGPALATALALALGWRGALLSLSLPIFALSPLALWRLSGAGAAAPAAGRGLWSSVAGLLRTKGVLAILAAQVALSGGAEIGILTTYVPVFLGNFLRMDVQERGLAYAAALLGGALGPIAIGSYAQRLGYVRSAAIAMSIASALTLLLIPYGPGACVALVTAHLFALMFVSFSLSTLLQAQLVRLTSGYDRDLVVGLFFTVLFSSSSLWMGLVGYIIDLYSSFRPALALMGCLTLLAPALLLAMGGTRSGPLGLGADRRP